MVKRLRNDEADLINWITKQGDFIRAHGRFPFTRRTILWPVLGIIGLALFAFVEFSFLDADKPWRPNPVIMIMTLSLLIQVVVRALRIKLKKIETGLPFVKTAEVIEEELRRLGYGAMWTDGKDVGIMRLEASTGFGKERHILVLVPDDSRLWITALDAKQPFVLMNPPKPFRRLVQKLRSSVSQRQRHAVPAQETA